MKLGNAAMATLLLVAAGIALALAAASWYRGEETAAAIAVTIGFALVILGLWRARRYRTNWRDEPASRSQKAFADKVGISYPPDATNGQIADLIEQNTTR